MSESEKYESYKEAITRTYSAYIAIWLKLEKETNPKVLEKIKDFFHYGDPGKLPTGLKPYEKSVKLYRTQSELLKMLPDINDESYKILEEVRLVFWEMSEEEFLTWYRERIKNKSESTKD